MGRGARRIFPPMATWLALTLLGCPGPVASVDTGPRSDAPLDAGPAPSLDRLPLDTWSFVPMPGAVCGNGSTAAIGVNPRAGARQVVMVISGGGACWDADTCFVRDTASHIDEDYTRAMLDSERQLISMLGWDDRGAPLNPFREANIVYVPYCTGDIHAGDAVQAYDPARPERLVHHRGGANMRLYLDAMRAAWPTIDTVRVIGFSAGGFGAQLNWGRLADAWPGASLSILADGAPLAELDPARYATWRASWNLLTPSDCAECAVSFSAYDDYFDVRHPSTRFGLTATLRDRVLTGFWEVPDYGTRVSTLLTAHLSDNATTRYFVVDSDQHGILGDALTLRGPDGTLLLDWVLGWLENDARFHNTAP